MSSINLRARDVEAIALSAATDDPIAETILASVVRAFHSVFEGYRATWR
jgi:hypothetical protein